ncbi:type IV pilus assembly protein PilE [Variovorax sp. SG517]|uniref:type IV pilin protein n=1 Tax=Variovorax sp. SG517 TaxID=2587117 RepID=UPI00159D6B2C|nr:type IV pilin protein [Variovorax sp. SG517]NVM89224.1 type IV pilus assembly protein PilE [Variovorax sp. SG517]
MKQQPARGRIGSSRAYGFTLIEIMITVVIIGVLAAIAIPSYQDYVRRGYVVDATNGLATMQANMERYFQDNRTYKKVSATIMPPCDAGVTASQRTFGNFVISCATIVPTDTTFTLVATGSGPANGAVYTITEQNVRATTGMPTAWSGWTTSCTSAWIVKKGQACPSS